MERRQTDRQETGRQRDIVRSYIERDSKTETEKKRQRQ